MTTPLLADFPPVPALKGRVNDYAGMISPQAQAQIERKLAALEAEDGTQIAVLTVPSLKGEPIEMYSIRVADAWKIGEKGRDNGVLLIVSKGDRKVRIEVGYGLEGRLTDLESGRIIRGVIQPAFAGGQFDAGFIGAADALVTAVKGEYKGNPPVKAKKSDKPSVPLVFIILAVLYFYLRQFGGRHHGGPYVSGGFGPGGGIFTSGGGFGGGGGGFGGGGASGDW